MPENDQGFVQKLKDMLGMDEDRAKHLIDQLDSQAMTTLTDALANDDRETVEQIAKQIDPDEEVNPLFRGDNLEDKVRKKKHRRKVASNYGFKFGDDVHVRVVDPETGKAKYEDGTVFIPDGPDGTIGVKIQGKSRMVDRKRVRRLEEGVLGMVGVPGLERMQQLAGIQPNSSEVTEITVPAAEQATEQEQVDPCAAAQQAMQALDTVAAVLPNVRLADLKVIRQRIVNLQTSMNESAH